MDPTKITSNAHDTGKVVYPLGEVGNSPPMIRVPVTVDHTSGEALHDLRKARKAKRRAKRKAQRRNR